MLFKKNLAEREVERNCDTLHNNKPITYRIYSQKSREILTKMIDIFQFDLYEGHKAHVKIKVISSYLCVFDHLKFSEMFK